MMMKESTMSELTRKIKNALDSEQFEEPVDVWRRISEICESENKKTNKEKRPEKCHQKQSPNSNREQKRHESWKGA